MVKVVMVVSEVGYTWDEVILPWMEFRAAGIGVDFATISGGKPPQSGNGSSSSRPKIERSSTTTSSQSGAPRR